MKPTTKRQQLWRDLLRIGFRLLYREMAWSYDLVSWLVSLGAWRQWQRAALPFLHGRSLLELGHGPGHMLLALQWHGYHVVGLDLSPQMGRLAQRRAPSAPLIRGEAQTLPFAAGAFDTVLATFPTLYVVEPATLRAVRRVLAENGRFVIVPEGHLTGNTPLHRFIEWLFGVTGQRPAEKGHEEGERPWDQFGQRFHAAGFRLETHTIRYDGSQATVIVAHK
jgi:ubiquinone/menaquinone biosynthesis C-methylase UbiE